MQRSQKGTMGPIGTTMPGTDIPIHRLPVSDIYIFRKIKAKNYKTPWIRAEVTRSLSDLQFWGYIIEPWSYQWMRQFDYSSHDWVQLSALTHRVTLLHNDFTQFSAMMHGQFAKLAQVHLKKYSA